MRGRHKAASDRKAPPFGAEIDDRYTLGPTRWKTPPKLRELVGAVLQPSDHGGTICRRDILARLKIRCRCRKPDAYAGLSERLEVRVVWDVVAVIVAQICSNSDDLIGRQTKIPPNSFYRDGFRQIARLVDIAALF
jgi:hypothetical protein